MIDTKDIDNKVFKHIYTWGGTLSSIACTLRASYPCTIIATSIQAVFVRDIIFNLTKVVHWQVITASKQKKADIGNVREDYRRVTYDYAKGNQFYV